MSIETVILIGLVALVSLFTYAVIRFAKKRLAAARKADTERAERIKRYTADKWHPQPAQRAQPAVSSVDVPYQPPKPSLTTPADYARAMGPSGSSGYRTSSASDDSMNILNDLASVAMIASTIRHWNDNDTSSRSESSSSSSSSSNNDSWGFDDSDSRKSAESSFSSSDSSSSWSDSSSSDSGPSSDW